MAPSVASMQTFSPQKAAKMRAPKKLKYGFMIDQKRSNLERLQAISGSCDYTYT